MVAVLFARKDSIYKQINCCDVYDIERDARTFSGGLPVIAHPPCRAWGRLRGLAKPRPDEKELAIWAVDQVRKNGGVLEHPKRSKLWEEANLPLPGRGNDRHGGWTLEIHQKWFGHRAEKKTWLYIVGINPKEIPNYSISLEAITHKVGGSRCRRLPEVSKSEREHTPLDLANWLVELATNCRNEN